MLRLYFKCEINQYHLPDVRSFFQVLGTNVVVLRWRLAGGGTEPTAGADKVVTTGESFGKGGNRQENGEEILCGGGASSDSVWVRDMGNDLPTGEGPRGFPATGSMADGGHGTQTSTVWDTGVPTHWGGTCNIGDVLDQGIYCPPPENVHTIH